MTAGGDVAWDLRNPSRADLPAALLAAALCLVHYATFFDAERPIATDVRYFLYFSWRIAEGAVPHLDLFDNKTFLASFVGALFYRVGSWVGAEPLQAIRVLCLGVSALTAWLSFVVFRRLAGGSQLGGFLGLLALLGFPFLGELPAFGIFPKLVMVALAPGAALLVADGRWLWAGVLGSLAFMDWQVGGVVWLGAFVTACACGTPRAAAALRVAAGGAAGLAPFLLYYALRGALLPAFQQTILASIYRGQTQIGLGLGERLTRIEWCLVRACAGHEWLFLLGLAGTLVAPFLLWSWRGSRRFQLLLPLLVYHFGIVGFSLVDFQRYPDFFALLHTAAFFLGLLWLALLAGLRRLFAGVAGSAGRWERVAAGGLVVLAVGITRPVLGQAEVTIATLRVRPEVTLSEQREVAEQVRKRIGSRRLVTLGASELLFLMRYVNPIPLVYFNSAAYGFYGDRSREKPWQTADRLLRTAKAEAFVIERRVPIASLRNRGLAREFELTEVRARSGEYQVLLFTRD